MKGTLRGRDHGLLLATVVFPTLVLAGEHDDICGPTWKRTLTV